MNNLFSRLVVFAIVGIAMAASINSDYDKGNQDSKPAVCSQTYVEAGIGRIIKRFIPQLPPVPLLPPSIPHPPVPQPPVSIPTPSLPFIFR